MPAEDIDSGAIMKARRFKNACNPFLRQAAHSLLALLRLLNTGQQ